MMLLSRAQELSPSTFYLLSNPKRNSHLKKSLSSQMHSAITIFHSLSPSLHCHHHQHHNIRRRRLLHTLSLFHLSPSIILSIPRNESPHFPLSASARTFVEQLAGGTDSTPVEENWDISNQAQSESFVFDASFDSTDLKHLKSPALEVKELEDLTEAWRRSKLAWLCKELPGHKTATLTRLLNAQRKWVRQEDVTYVTVHLMRIRENETAFRAYKWMTRQHWFQFDFALATKLADFMGKVRKYTKCREIFNDIINQGKVPCESTFHMLTIAYLSSSEPGCLEEACSIYNRMIQLGGYKPRLTLHNSLFKALVSKPGGSTKYYLKQAEFIFHNLETCGLEIHQDVYGGLIWLHSYQDTIDKERIASLRLQMHALGIQESKKVLVSVLRACSKEGDVVEAENTWHKLFQCDGSTPSQAYVHKMEVYAKDGQPLKSLEIFRGMKEELGSASVVAYHKVIEVLSKAQEIELTESLMKEFIESGLKPLMPSFIDITDMYLKLGLHDKLESTFSLSVEKCRPNRTICNIYLDSLVKIGNIEKAEAVFNEMVCNSAIGVNARSCNTILRGYLHSEEYLKAEKIHNLMCRKKYELEPALVEKLDYALSLSRKAVQRPIIMKLSKEQREILVGLLLGGLRIESDEDRKNHAIRFEFYDTIDKHFLLKRHIYDQFHEWLASLSKPDDSGDDIPWQFSTISHSYFGFYAEQFWPKGAPVVPKLIHRWLSPRSLAYWYMFGGYRTSSGDILLKLKGNLEGAERIVKVLKTKSLDCKVKQKGRVYWVGFLGSNSIRFWKLVEPYIVDDLREFLEPGGYSSDRRVQNQVISFDGGSDSDAETSDSGDWDGS